MASSHSAFDYDLAVVGGGSAGYAAARIAAAAGLRIVVLEGGEEVGGLCILRGCMPSKALLYAAEVMHLATDRTCPEEHRELVARYYPRFAADAARMGPDDLILSIGRARERLGYAPTHSWRG